MNIQPSREQYVRLSRHSKRVPILGAERVPDFNPALLYRHLYGNSPHSFLFESGKGPAETARYSMMGQPNSRSIRIQDQTAFFTHSGAEKPELITPLRGLEILNFNPGILSTEYTPHFWGGWVGYIGYELGGLFERLPVSKENDSELPDLFFMEVDRLVVYDHVKGLLKYIVAPEIGDPERTYSQSVEDIRNAWDEIHEVLERPGSARQMDTRDLESCGRATDLDAASFQSNLTREAYMERVRRTQEYIRDGDIYQANLAQRFETECSEDPLELYLRLRKLNPSPFSGCLKLDDLTLVSSSPERLVKMDGDNLETRPIAGTRPRGFNNEQDRILCADLLLNQKERAEHLMLVDLERNDLGRICRTGTVRVTDLMFLEKYSHVSHIVSNIQGRLKPGTSVADVLRAVFPGGTITGCPKIRCMEIINELEPHRRGPYSGSFGYIGYSPCMDLNIIIRTILLKNGKAFFHVGAGIVADSIPEKEYQETLDKAAAMMAVLSPAPRSC